MFGSQTTERVVGFRSETNGTSEGEGNVFTSVMTFGIDFTNVQLDGSMILRGDKAVGSRANYMQDRVVVLE